MWLSVIIGWEIVVFDCIYGRAGQSSAINQSNGN